MKTMRATLLAMLGAVSLAAPPTTEGALVHWRLAGVTFDDGTTAQGTFTYDDVAATVTAWNIAVQRGAPTLLIPFAYMPGASFAPRFWTSISTGMLRVLTSTERAILDTTPLKVCPGNAGTLNETRPPGANAPASASGTATVSRKRPICSILSKAVPLPGPTNAPGCTLRAVITPSKEILRWIEAR